MTVLAIKSHHHSIKTLFEQTHTFEVPKYQRDYAWDEDAIDEFLEDVGRCLKARVNGTRRHHFFGGIVTVRKDVPRSNRTNYEVIDGQQRLASFVMLIAAVIHGMEDVVKASEKKTGVGTQEKKARAFLVETIDTLKGLYLKYRDSIELEYVEVSKLTLSKANDEFFQNTITGKLAFKKRASHERIQAAWSRLATFVTQKVATANSISETAKRFQHLVDGVLAEDCTVIFMGSETRSEAYQIFQVLNDRGVHLTDGDLLRARTLEVLDSNAFRSTQDAVAVHWDNILGYQPNSVDDYLRWYFSSLEARRPRSADLANQFLECRFKCKDDASITKSGADAIVRELKQIEAEFVQLKTLGDGEWPFSQPGAVKRWDRERLRMLVTHLKHTNAMPLLLSLMRLGEKKFAEGVASLERFVFRYKTVGNAHIGPMTELYLREAKLIRESPAYPIKRLRQSLAELVQKVVPDSVFETTVRELRYAPKAGNGSLRYLMIVLEEHIGWYEDGAQGSPKCQDKKLVFDFLNTTLDHIYPQSIPVKNQDVELEKVLHSLGNLTILGPEENDKIGNKPFADKRADLHRSSLRLNRNIGGNAKWTADDVKKRTEVLARIAVKVFVP